jgi:hypothetical protein
MQSESGVYCGPLKLLASEVFYKTNAAVKILTLFIEYLLNYILYRVQNVI